VLDGGLVTGYLTAALLRGARRVADQTVESLLERLIEVVELRLGRRPLEQLERSPSDAEVHAQVARNIDAAIDTDPAFAGELATVIAQLDQHGAHSLVNQVEARFNVQAIESSLAAGRDLTYLNHPDPTDLSGAPSWAKTCIVIGVLLVFTGVAVGMYGVTTINPDTTTAGPPPGFVASTALTIIGFFVLAAGILGRLMSPHR
jgi:hypothetical protein